MNVGDRVIANPPYGPYVGKEVTILKILDNGMIEVELEGQKMYALPSWLRKIETKEMKQK